MLQKFIPRFSNVQWERIKIDPHTVILIAEIFHRYTLIYNVWIKKNYELSDKYLVAMHSFQITHHKVYSWFSPNFYVKMITNNFVNFSRLAALYVTNDCLKKR